MTFIKGIEMKRVVWIILGYLVLLTNVQADELVKFIRPLCIPEVHYFELTNTSMWNGVPDLRDSNISDLLKRKYSIFPEAKPGKLSCTMDARKLVVHYTSSTSSGACGLEGGSRFLIDLWIDDVQVLSKIVLADECSSSSVTRIWSSGNTIGFDGYPAFGMNEVRRLVSFFAFIGDGKVSNLGAADVSLPITMPMLEQRIAGLAQR
jgi:hypothetical protein